MPQGQWQTLRAARALRRGGLVAYPTEAVWGLGCDPANQTALARLLELKQRPWQKGLILIAARWDQLSPWLSCSQPPAFDSQVLFLASVLENTTILLSYM